MNLCRPLVLCLFSLCISLQLVGQNIGDQDKMISIFFGGGSYYIDSEQLNDLEDIVNSIDDFREYEVELHGHTDNIGSIEFNQYLSEMRCRAVFIELLRMDINRDIISVHEYGELSPVYSNGSFGGQLSNRRVDVIIRKIMI